MSIGHEPDQSSGEQSGNRRRGLFSKFTDTVRGRLFGDYASHLPMPGQHLAEKSQNLNSEALVLQHQTFYLRAETSSYEVKHYDAGNRSWMMNLRGLMPSIEGNMVILTREVPQYPHRQIHTIVTLEPFQTPDGGEVTHAVCYETEWTKDTEGNISRSDLHTIDWTSAFWKNDERDTIGIAPRSKVNILSQLDNEGNSSRFDASKLTPQVEQLTILLTQLKSAQNS